VLRSSSNVRIAIDSNNDDSGRCFSVVNNAYGFDGGFTSGNSMMDLCEDSGFTLNANFLQSGTGTFATGSGNVSLNGNVSVASGKTLIANGATTVKNDSAAAFSVQTSGGNQVLGVDTSGAGVLFGKAGVSNGKLVLYSGTAANNNTVTLQAGNTSASYALTLPTAGPSSTGQCLKAGATTATNLEWGACSSGGNTRTVTLVPEYAGAVLTAPASNNSGTMTSDYVSGLSSGQGTRHNYYQWSSTNSSTLQSYDVVVRTAIPGAYASGFGNFKIWVYGDSNSTASNDVQVSILDAAGNTCSSAVSVLPGTAATWTQQSVSLGTCTTFAADDVLTIDIKTSSKSSNNVRIGEMSYQYTN
jgi:hypothetical protein